MKVFLKLCTSFAVIAVSSYTHAVNSQLSGENVILFPELDIPFSTKQTYVNRGVKDVDGSCIFPLDAGPDREVQPHEIYMVTQTSWDPSTCKEVLEKGYINVLNHPEYKVRSSTSQKAIGGSAILVSDPNSASADLLPGTSTSTTSENQPDVPVDYDPTGVPTYSKEWCESWGGYQKNGYLKIYYTDRDNPLIEAINTVVDWEGFLLSEVEASGYFCADYVTYEGGCGWIYRETYGRFNTDKGALGWKDTYPPTINLRQTCRKGIISVQAKHENSSHYPGAFDCRDKLTIAYEPMELHIQHQKQNEFVGSVRISGDMTDCGGNARRFQVGPL